MSNFSIPDVGNIDISKLSRKGSSPDYIPYNTRGRDAIGRVSFNTGVFWVTGSGIGGGYGFVEGWRGATSQNYKIRFNSVMNSFSKRGSSLGNALGILAFMHTTTIIALDQLEVEKYLPSEFTTPVLAGVITGGLYKSTRSPRAIALASLAGGISSCVYWFGGPFIYNKILGMGGKY